MVRCTLKHSLESCLRGVRRAGVGRQGSASVGPSSSQDRQCSQVLIQQRNSFHMHQPKPKIYSAINCHLQHSTSPPCTQLVMSHEPIPTCLRCSVPLVRPDAPRSVRGAPRRGGFQRAGALHRWRRRLGGVVHTEGQRNDAPNKCDPKKKRT